MSESIHTVRWINQLKNEGWDIYLFPSYDNRGIHQDLDGVEICIPFFSIFNWLDQFGLGKYFSFLHRKITRLNRNSSNDYYSKRLKRYIEQIKPDIIHSLETQGGGFLVAKVKSEYYSSSPFPKWWHTNWGSDIFLLGRLPEQKPLIKRVVTNCDFYSCECTRDIDLARSFGFSGTAFLPYPNTGGFDPSLIKNCKNFSLETAKRKVIMLKGYQGWAGRALVGIRALERCGNLIKDYEIVIYSNGTGEDVYIASTLLSQNTGAKVTILPDKTPHSEIMKYHSLARISIGLSIGDAISTSLLEAMAMGSFPIQSCTACASEWFTDGISGLIVTPEDPEIVENAIRKALLDDILVNSASEINYRKILVDANFDLLRTKTIENYKIVLDIAHV